MKASTSDNDILERVDYAFIFNDTKTGVEFINIDDGGKGSNEFYVSDFKEVV